MTLVYKGILNGRVGRGRRRRTETIRAAMYSRKSYKSTQNRSAFVNRLKDVD